MPDGAALPISLRRLAERGSSAARLEKLLHELWRPGNEVLNQVDVRWLAEAIGDTGLRSGYQHAYAALIAEPVELLEPEAGAVFPPDALAELIAAIIVGIRVRKAIIPEANVSPALNALLALLK
jgi:hypothetical protein